ncbi:MULTISPECIES: TetR/AcrR family transcriptional regulator [Geomicrobium]|uniref:TetR/AcrR family fatty acid metabolism transcriptional regulator n=1 Tax=Geomicrobium sediminis TaxID=1347788 RepID=A0ABS2P8P0_9BACL|nr:MULTISPECIES: TetR/AcrR family transcriptional regulator [Geomicrobium]EZH66782.1 TetR family transcriptional regulator [Bacillaceae bacterium JMAK1]MBM7631770.1 TetR/AcrR family fatty acid metabolism transcriptional regulator [Geomicrobium sediminis]GAJ99330.1 fatty acid degradation regulator YsiA, TetR family [Geomicrobium sp. JCM 19055]
MAVDKRNSEKYHLIIDAAVTVIAKHGYHHAQVSKIAKEAGVADGTIYLYFKNKEDILISLFRLKMGTFITTIEKRLETCFDAKEKLRFLVEMHLSQLAEQPDLAVVTQLELRQSARELRLKINDVLKGYVQVMENVIDEGKAEGIFQEQLDTKLARQMLFGTLDEIVTNWVMKEGKFDLESLSQETYHMLLTGFQKSS